MKTDSSCKKHPSTASKQQQQRKRPTKLRYSPCTILSELPQPAPGAVVLAPVGTIRTTRPTTTHELYTDCICTQIFQPIMYHLSVNKYIYQMCFPQFDCSQGDSY